MQFRRIVSSLCLLAACTMAAIGCQSAPADNSAEPAIRQWLTDWTTAFQSKNIDGIKALYASDVVAYDVIPPLQYVGKDAYIKDYGDFFGSFQGPLMVEIKDCHISSSGNLAYAACLERFSGTTTKGQKVDSWIRETSVFRLADGKWLDIHDHASYPADMDSGKALMDLKP